MEQKTWTFNCDKWLLTGGHTQNSHTIFHLLQYRTYCWHTYPELLRVGQVGEVGFKLNGFLQALQEHVLELHDFLDVAKQLLRVFARQERLFLEWFQVALYQTVQVLQKHNAKKPSTNMAMYLTWEWPKFQRWQENAHTNHNLHQLNVQSSQQKRETDTAIFVPTFWAVAVGCFPESQLSVNSLF